MTSRGPFRPKTFYDSVGRGESCFKFDCIMVDLG